MVFAINGLSAKTGGGVVIFVNFIQELINDNDRKFETIIFTNSKNEDTIRELVGSKENIKIICLKGLLVSTFIIPFTNTIILPFFLYRHKAEIVLNFSDIPILTKIKQIFYFDWAFAAYEESEAWDRLSKKNYVKYKLKLKLFKLYSNSINKIIVQTNSIRNALLSKYTFQDIIVLPNSVSLIKSNSSKRLSNIDDTNAFKLLCLSSYYPHKNIEILLEVAQLLKKNNLNVKILLTLNTEDSSVKMINRKIDELGVNDYIKNIGSVPYSELDRLYNSIDALILPTLIESFTATYIEAMHYKKSILTSNLDFAKDICGDAAFYFNPLDSVSILDTIEIAMENEILVEKKIAVGEKVVNNFPSWKYIYNKIVKFSLD